jgi:hypothetical protein
MRLIYMLTLLLLWLINIPARAQNLVEFSNVVVDIRPEYDRRDVLVIYQIALSPQVSLPTKINLRIPKEAGEPFAVAMKENNDLVNLVYTTAASGDWLLVSFTTPVPDVWVEYYDPRLQRSQTRRDFDFVWPGDYTVQNLTLQVQQPASASQMVFTPSLGSGRQGADGLTYFSAMEGKVGAGVSFVLKFSYEKPDDTLTAPSQPVQPSVPIGQTTPGQQNVETLLLIALGIFGLLLIGVASWWYLSYRRVPHPASRKRHSSKKAVGKITDGDSTVFCHQCGNRAGAGDLYCRICGTRLRVE